MLFFFQAEDGIRDIGVTGVQTCALPILLEEGYWVPMLRREPVDPDALRELAGIMERPQIQLSLFSAISTRLNRAYGPILLVLTLSWFVKVYSQPWPARTFAEFVDRAHIGPIHGGFVMAFFFLL